MWSLLLGLVVVLVCSAAFWSPPEEVRRSVECDQDSGVVLVGLCLGRLGGAVACPYIYARAGGVSGGGGRTPGAGECRAPPRPPTHQANKGRLGGCARAYVSAVAGRGIEFEAGAPAGRPFACVALRCVRRHRAPGTGPVMA